MDSLCNIQQLKECFRQQTKFYIPDISEAIKLLSKIGQNLDDTIIRKLQAENNIRLKYTSMEEPTKCNRQTGGLQLRILPWNWGAGWSNSDRLAAEE